MSELLKALADASNACKRVHDVALRCGREDVAARALTSNAVLVEAIRAIADALTKPVEGVVS